MNFTAEELHSYLDVASQFILDQGGRVVEEWEKVTISHWKEQGRDLSTNFDEEIEQQFAALIKRKFPEHGFRGEEFAELNRKGELVWHIDPIDGTKYFAKGIPFWSITVALVQAKEPLVGLIYNPVAKQLYYAYQGGGAYLNSKKLTVEPQTDLGQAQIAYDFPVSEAFHKYYNASSLAKKLSAAEFCQAMYKHEAQLRGRAFRVRDLGSAAFSLAWLAQNLFAGYIVPAQPGAKFVDVAAGLLIAQEAGAKLYRHDISADLYQLVVAASDELLAELKRYIRA